MHPLAFLASPSSAPTRGCGGRRRARAPPACAARQARAKELALAEERARLAGAQEKAWRAAEDKARREAEAREAEAWLGAEAQEAETWLEAEARQLDAAHS